MTIVPSNVVCPRCHSRDLYRFGKDLQEFQRYQCKICKRQFAPDNPPSHLRPAFRKYPDCPVCGKATFLHHDFTYYSNYRCCDKRCNHSFTQAKDIEVSPPSSALDPAPFSMKRMRHPLPVVLLALNYFFMANVTTRKAAQLLWASHQVSISHVTISRWIKRFAPVFQTIAQFIQAQLVLSDSDEWHFDETYVKINGQDYYLWLVIDSETRFVLDFHLSPCRDSNSAHTLLKSCHDKFGSPASAVVSDRYSCYIQPASKYFPDVEHIQVEDFHDLISNNLIEAFNNQFKAWYKPRRGFGSFVSANRLIATFIFFYNFLRPHSSLSGLTPAQVAGHLSSDRERSSWFLIA
jgi:transposase-like protein